MKDKCLKKYIKWTKEKVPLKDFSVLDDFELLKKNFNKKPELFPLKKEDVKYIVIHHAEIDSGNVQYYNWLHKGVFGWDMIGYHFVIGNGRDGLSKDGEIEKGRDLKWRGAHVKKHNHESIGICLVGNLDNYNPTQSQYNSLLKLVRKLMNEYGIDFLNVYGHNEFEGVSKTCPGRNFDMDKFREILRNEQDSF